MKIQLVTRAWLTNSQIRFLTANGKPQYYFFEQNSCGNDKIIHEISYSYSLAGNWELHNWENLSYRFIKTKVYNSHNPRYMTDSLWAFHDS